MQTYTSGSKTAGKRQNSYSTLYSLTSEIKRQRSSLSVYGLERRPECILAPLDPDKKDSLKTMLDTFEDWTSLKSDEIAVFTQLRALNQGNKTLFTYIQEVRRVVDLCNFDCVGDCKDRLIRNSIVAGLNSTKAYQQCISKGSSLTLNECIKICQTEDATCRQVQALHPESADCSDSTSIHKITHSSQQ